MKSYNLSQINAVIVDPFQGMRLLYRSVLRVFELGYISDYSDFDNAYHYIQMAAPDFVYIDWSPTFDGLDFVARLRDEEAKNRFIPIILISSLTTGAAVTVARDAGIDEFLAKPVSAELMYARLCAVIESNRPFVKADAYFGPNRRRREREFDGEERRTAEKKAD